MTNISMPQPSQQEIAALFQELTSPAGQAAIANSVASNLEFTDGGAALNNLVASMGAWMAMHPGSSPSDFFNTPEGQAAVAAVGGAVNTEKLQAAVTQAVAQQLGTTPDAVGQVMADRVANYYAAQMIPVLQAQLTTAIQDYMTNYMTQLTGQMTSVLSNIGNAMGVNPDAFANAFQINMDQDELTELMMSMMRVEEHSYDNNLKKLGYADFN